MSYCRADEYSNENDTENRPPPKPPVENLQAEPSVLKLRDLTEEEFNSVPKYMKGRITICQVNAVIGKCNEILEKKYKLLDMAKKKGGMKTLSKADKDLVILYREQENSDTVGHHFFVESQLKDSLLPKDTSLLKHAGPILRQCRRCRESRGQKFVRYVVLPH